MGTTTGRLTSGFLVLAIVWIAVYWLWEPRRSSAPISFASAAQGERPESDRPSPDRPRGTGREQPRGSNPGSASSNPKPGPGADDPSRADPPAVTPKPVVPVVPPAPVTPKPDPGPSVVPPAFVEHTLVSGDTFPSLARRYLGNENLGGVIARANPLMDPRKLKPGRVVRIPVDPSNIQGKPVPGAGSPGTPGAEPPTPRVSEYVVQSGDTLSGIAEELLGDSSRADEIFRLNRDVLSSPDELKLGMKLKVPQEQGRER